MREAVGDVICNLAPIGIGGGYDFILGVGGTVSGGLSVNPQNGQISLFGSKGVAVGGGIGRYGAVTYNAPTGLDASLTQNVTLAGLLGGTGSIELIGDSPGEVSYSAIRAGSNASLNTATTSNISFPITPEFYSC